MNTQAWIESTLANDEISSDEELITHFVEEGQISKEEAICWVAKRNDFLSGRM